MSPVPGTPVPKQQHSCVTPWRCGMRWELSMTGALACAALLSHATLPSAQPQGFRCRCRFGCTGTTWVLAEGVAVGQAGLSVPPLPSPLPLCDSAGHGQQRGRSPVIMGDNNLSSASPLPETQAGGAGILRAELPGPERVSPGLPRMLCLRGPPNFCTGAGCPQWLLQSSGRRGRCSGTHTFPRKPGTWRFGL